MLCHVTHDAYVHGQFLKPGADRPWLPPSTAGGAEPRPPGDRQGRGDESHAAPDPHHHELPMMHAKPKLV
jgi:hypothetical protein